MTDRTTWILAAAILILAAAIYFRPESGRYELVSSPDGAFFVHDTSSARIWEGKSFGLPVFEVKFYKVPFEPDNE